jgi:serine/threonine protein kinase
MICDFGCARVAADIMTMSVGTLLWQAPELWEITRSDQRYTNKVDIWAFGLVMYQVLSNGKLWPSDIAGSIGKLQYGIMNGRRPDIQNNPECEWVWDLIQKCWERDPNNRPTMPQILATLKENKFEVAKGVDHEKVMDYFFWVEMNRAK